MAKTQTKILILMAITLVACFAGTAFLSRSQSAETLFLVVLSGIALTFCEYMAFSLFARDKPLRLFGLSAKKSFLLIVIVSIVIGLLLEIGTLVGAPLATPLSLSDWSGKRIVLFSFVVFGGILFRYWYWDKHAFASFADEIRHSTMGIRAKNAIGALVVLVVVFGISSFALLSSGHSVKSSIGFSAALAISVAGIVLLWQYHDTHPEYGFFIIAIAIGTYLAFAIPAITLVSWDDQVHYKNAVSLSYVFNAEASDGETSIRSPELFLDSDTGIPATLVNTSEIAVDWQEGDLDNYATQIDSAIVEEGYHPAESEFSPLSYQSFGYLGSAAAFWIARLLHLPFSFGFNLAKWFNLLNYAIICFMALRVLPVKKTLFAAIALIPTEVFLASNLSYDPWVVSMTGLAVALTLREICDRERFFNPKSFAAISIAFILGLGPKAIYFPLIGLLFLMPRCKFSLPRKYRAYIGATIVLGVIVVASFALSFLVTSGGAGDTRGGMDVNSAEQVRFIISEPFRALQIISGFIFGQYLTLPTSDSYTLFFAYMGLTTKTIPWLSCVPALLLICTAIADNFGLPKISGIGGKIWTAFLCLLTVFLFTLALYVSFTPVGLNTVNGVQGRYLIPLVFPFLAVCSSFNIKNPMPKRAFSGIVLSASTLLLVTSVLTALALRIAV